MNTIRRFFFGLMLCSMMVTACQSFSFQSHVTPAPTPQCIEPSLTLGSTKFKMEVVERGDNGFPDVSQSKKETAYWVENTTVNYVFALTPTEDNLALGNTLNIGDPITIHWADCTRDEYAIESIDSTASIDTEIFNQSSGGVTVYIQESSSTLLIHGIRPIIQLTDVTLEPTSEFPQPDISILGMTESEDHQFVTFKFLITNQGSQSFTLTSNDISLTVENNPEVFPTRSDPLLPQSLGAGDIILVNVTFSKPQVPSVVLRVFDIMFEYYFQ